MANPDILVTNRIGYGYLSTTFNDPTDLAVTFRKWIFGDGVIIDRPAAGVRTHGR